MPVTVISYPIQFVCSCEGVSKCEHEHLGSELLRPQLVSGVGLLEVECVGVGVGVVAYEA